MTLFEDLVAELQKENLLDGKINNAFQFKDSWAMPNAAFASDSAFYYFAENIEFVYPNLPRISSVFPPSRNFRKVKIRQKKKGRFCKTCLIKVPYHRFSCKFCGERVTSKLVYYPIVIFFVATILVALLAVIASKTYI